MNRLPAKILNVKVHADLSLVKLDVLGAVFHSIVIATPESEPLLNEGREVHVMFKETETALGTDPGIRISLQNRLECQITAIERGELLARVHLEYSGHSIISVVTARAISQLGLDDVEQAVIFVKTNEIMLTP